MKYINPDIKVAAKRGAEYILIDPLDIQYDKVSLRSHLIRNEESADEFEAEITKLIEFLQQENDVNKDKINTLNNIIIKLNEKINYLEEEISKEFK